MLKSTLVHISVSKMPRKDTTKVKKKRARKGMPTLKEITESQDAKREAERKARLEKKKRELQFRSSTPLDVSPKPTMRK